jgi:hypothetical protein
MVDPGGENAVHIATMPEVSKCLKRFINNASARENILKARSTCHCDGPNGANWIAMALREAASIKGSDLFVGDLWNISVMSE